MHATQGDWATEWGILDPQILFLPGSWAELTAATGNWDGIRTDLSDAGISAFGSYQSESAGNPVGGEVHKLRYTHNIALGIAMDLHRLLGLSDTYFLASASERTGNSLSNDIPNFFQVQQIYGHQTIRLVDLALEHLFFDKKLDVVGRPYQRTRRLRDLALLLFCAEPRLLRQSTKYPGQRLGPELPGCGLGNSSALRSHARVLLDDGRLQYLPGFPQR